MDMERFDVKRQHTSLLLFVAFWLPNVCRKGHAYVQNPSFVTVRRVLLISIDRLHILGLAWKSKPSNYFQCLLSLGVEGFPISTGVWYEGADT